MSSKQSGYSYLELMLAVTLVFIFIAMALKMLVRFSVDAEQMGMADVLRSLENAMTNLTAEQLVKNDMAGLSRWQDGNPMELLPIKPDNYAGEFSNRDNKPASGNWYYDQSAKRLVYLVKHEKKFSSGKAGDARARYQLKFLYADSNGNRRFDPETDEPQGLRLEPEGEYRWLD